MSRTIFWKVLQNQRINFETLCMTSKLNLSWYVKWTASVFLICAFAVRSSQLYPFIDLCLSLIGVSGWLWVGLLWKDRALIILNGIAVFILLSGLIRHFTPVLIA